MIFFMQFQWQYIFYYQYQGQNYLNQIVFNTFLVNYNFQLNNSNRAKGYQMQSAQETKSTDKNSSHQSQDRRRRRPSLFPIRNSAKRKSSLSENHHIFDPHEPQSSSTKISMKKNQEDIFNSRESKSQSQFQYRTPTLYSECSTPRTTKSSPKDFIADTPFVPFVHQSLTKTVWQSQEVIPQEKDDVQRKQSQTQMYKYYQNQQPVKQQKFYQNQDASYESGSRNFQKQQYSNNQNLIRSNQNTIKNQIIENNQEYQVNLYSPLETYVAVSINIPKAQELPQNTTQAIYQISYQQSNQAQIKNEQSIIKKQVSISQKNPEVQSYNQIQHNVFVSRAPFYYEQQKQKIDVEKSHVKSSIYQQDYKQSKFKKLSFSYIDSVSVRTVVKDITDQSQQTSPKKLQTFCIPNLQVHTKQKSEKQCQTTKQKMTTCNSTSERISSTKKQNYQTQTSIAQRLKIITQKFDQKIGIPKTYVQRGDQMGIQTASCGFQTENNKKKFYSIYDQVNFSIHNNYEEKIDQRLQKLQNYIKNMYQNKQRQINDLRNKKHVHQQMNTETQLCSEQKSLKSHEKKQNKNITVRSFAAQYDPKDFGNQRPSLKRVSIADTKIIYQIEESNSTQTFDIKEKKQQKSKQREKEKKKKSQVKLEQRPQQQSQLYVPEPQQNAQVRKSKRKASKTPKKKSKH